MKIDYKIDLHTYWHCGSGLAAGAGVDSLVIKDAHKLPYIPGKTIKGLIKEAVDEIIGLEAGGESFVPSESYTKTFGYFTDDKNEMVKSEAFFSNAELDKDEADNIIDGGLQRFMYDSVCQTAIDETGIAKDHSLRKIQVVVPCTLYGTIMNVPNEMAEILEKGMKFTKCLGLSRNRGLGRCTISITKKEV